MLKTHFLPRFGLENALHQS